MGANSHVNTINCTIETCPVSESIYTYIPSLAANAAFLALFALSGLIHVVHGVITGKTAFWIAIAIGCVTEIIGYVGRLISHHDVFNQNGFLTQIICLTLAPAFFSAGIYFCLGEIVRNFAPGASRIKASGYAKIFIPCDVVSLVLQGAGGGIASVLSQQNKNPKVGTNIMVAGLSFQVGSMALFMCLAGEYFLRLRRWTKESGNIPVSRTRIVVFLIFFPLAIITIFIRCVYRVVELSEGWTGHLIEDQATFIGLEGTYVYPDSSVFFLLTFDMQNGPGGILRFE